MLPLPSLVRVAAAAPAGSYVALHGCAPMPALFFGASIHAFIRTAFAVGVGVVLAVFHMLFSRRSALT